MGESATDITAADIVGWDIRTWSKAVEYWMTVVPPGGPPLKCLEIGAGPGGPSLWLALQGHDVTTSNFANTREQARPLHERFGVDSITYRDVDATDVQFEAEFDLVIFKSVLGGAGSTFEQQRAVVQQMHKALKPGGRLLFAENLRGTWLHRAARAVAYRVRGSSWRFVSVPEMHEMLSVFASHELHTTGSLALFGMSERQRNALARLDEAFANRLTPSRWRYVSFGSAMKAL